MSENRPHLCMIFEAVTLENGIGKAVIDGIRAALNAGYRVTVVAQSLDKTLQSEVEWLPLYVPPRLYLLQWLTARRFITRALGGRSFDVVHSHQPQVAALSDVFQCHFITQVALDRGCLESRSGLRPAINRWQQRTALIAEDRYYRRWNPNTYILYNSEMTRQDFHRIYGAPPREGILVTSPPPLRFASEEERRQARQALLGSEPRQLVIGYLGGMQYRKGYERLIQAMEREPDLFLLIGGQYTEGIDLPQLRGRYKSVGLVRDVSAFYAACDLFIVPSRYEPLGLVAFEAAARGLPVIATPEVGALPHLLEYGMGAAWSQEAPLGPLATALAAKRAECNAATVRMAEDLGVQRYAERLVGVYEQVLRTNRDRTGMPAAGRA